MMSLLDTNAFGVVVKRAERWHIVKHLNEAKQAVDLPDIRIAGVNRKRQGRGVSSQAFWWVHMLCYRQTAC